jgi:hypothetical protein
LVNILEDHVETLDLVKPSKGTGEVKLDFRAYEIKTVKVYLRKVEKRREENVGWVKV